MLARSKPAASLPSRRRRSWERGGKHLGTSTPEPIREATRSRRQGGQSQDRALYTCSCGLAFDALVSTSVGCPRCGSTQAW